MEYRTAQSRLVIGLSLCCLAAAPDAGPPPAPKKPVVDDYHGTRVTDDYRWLEDLKDPAVRSWVEKENRYSRAYLDQIPERTPLFERIKSILSATSPGYGAIIERRGLLFAMKRQPPKQQPFLVTLKSADEPASERVLLDPNKLNPKGTTAIDWYVPSLDGRLVAVSLSDNGSEDGTVHVYEAATGKELPDVIPRVQFGTAGGSATWNSDGSGLYYTRYPAAGERPEADLHFFQQVYFHKLGTPVADDTYAMGKDLPRIAEIELTTKKGGGRYVLATVGNGDGGEYAHYLLGPGGTWTQLTRFADQVVGAAFGVDDTLYLLSRQGAPRGKVLRLSLSDPRLAAVQALVPESKSVITAIVPTDTRLYVAGLLDGVAEVRVFDHAGKAQAPVPLRAASSVYQVVHTRGDSVLLHSETFLEPAAWYLYDPNKAALARTALFRTSPVDFGDIEVVRDFCTSKDGTKVPISILRRKGTKLDGRNPALLKGYGGFGISLTPNFGAARHVWLENGGVEAVAHIRGGGEYGEDWHHGGYRSQKQNGFDDFTACARYLIDAKYTNPDKLAIEGGSNGGLLMGAQLTQHPELFRAVVTHVGLYDMLRFEQAPNGQFNVTEYGTVKDPEQFKVLRAYSPYQRVADRTAYPAVFFLTGDNDPRVDPAQSRKMVARLQAATSSGRPILLRTTATAGHGVDAALSERIAQAADVNAFLFRELGIKLRPGT